jgi:hypothetical protein
MEGYQMFTIFIPKKAQPEGKKKAVQPAAAAAPEKKKEPRAETPKPKAEPKSDDEIF